jgi:hypothetical protein
MTIKSIKMRNYTSGKSKGYSWDNEVSLASIANRWKEITGQPDSCYWLDELRIHVTNKKNNWTTPFTLLKNYPIKHIAHMKKNDKIKDVFMFVNSPEEKRAIAKFLAREGIDSDTLETLFPDVLENLPLDQNEEPQPEPILTRENIDPPNKKPRLDLDLNKKPAREKPARELDLNQTPPAEQVEPDDGGGGGE